MRIGIDIGGSHVATGLVGKNGSLVSKESRDINISNIKDEKRVENLLLEIIENEIATLLGKNDFTVADISKIGVAVPGSPKRTCIRNLVNLHIKEFNLGEKLKDKGANNIYFTTTFALFTEGIDEFNKAYQNEYFTKLYTTNLSYIKEEYKDNPWFHTVDCSSNISEIINALHNKESLRPLQNGKEKILALIKNK